MILIFVKLPLLLLILYIIGIQYERTTLPASVRTICEAIAILALLLDVTLNYSVFTVYFLQLPETGEYTFSERINRLCLTSGWRSAISNFIGRILNFFAPGNNHIPNAK